MISVILYFIFVIVLSVTVSFYTRPRKIKPTNRIVTKFVMNKKTWDSITPLMSEEDILAKRYQGIPIFLLI